MEMDSIFAAAIRALFKIGNELFGLQSLATKGLIAGGNARTILNSLRRCVNDISAALDGIESQVDAKWPK